MSVDIGMAKYVTLEDFKEILKLPNPEMERTTIFHFWYMIKDINLVIESMTGVHEAIQETHQDIGPCPSASFIPLWGDLKEAHDKLVGIIEIVKSQFDELTFEKFRLNTEYFNLVCNQDKEEYQRDYFNRLKDCFNEMYTFIKQDYTIFYAF